MGAYEGLRWRFINKSIPFWRWSFPFWQRLGIHITPDHYLFPVPNTGQLDPDLWRRQSELVGIKMNEEFQITLLEQFVSAFKKEYESFPRERTSIPYQYYVNNRGFRSVDGEILYCMIRHFKPRIVFEIGSGNSTYLAAQAILKNREEGGHDCTLTSCEPHPDDILRAGFPGLSTLRTTLVQNVPLDEFTQLRENDILFIDSSHVLKIGGDVQYEYLDILPRLNRGVLIHVHDIFLPNEYPKEWILRESFFWNEQYLLQAFLTFNSTFEVLWAGGYMHVKHPDVLGGAFDSYDRDHTRPGSFWMRRTQ